MKSFKKWVSKILVFSVVLTTCFSHVQFSYANNENQNEETTVAPNETTEETKESIEEEIKGEINEDLALDEEENVSSDESETEEEVEEKEFSESTETNDIEETEDTEAEVEETTKEVEETEVEIGEVEKKTEESNFGSLPDVASKSETEKEIKISTESFIDVDNDNIEKINYGFIPEMNSTPISRKRDKKGSLYGTENIPSSYDSRQHTNQETGLSYISPVRRQSPYGTCWAFSTLAMFESSARIQGLAKTDADADLSEAAVAYFMYELKDVTKNSKYLDSPGLEGNDFVHLNVEDFAEFGGNLEMSTLAASSYLGVVKEDDESSYQRLADYVGNLENYTMDGNYAFKKNKYVLKNAYYLNKNNRDLVKKAIMDNGSVGISYHAGQATVAQSGGDDRYMHKFGTEYYYFTNKEPEESNHAIAIVGWDDSVPASNFYFTNAWGTKIAEAKNNGAWLCRNSWGSNYSLTNGGYFWMSYEEPSLRENMYSVEVMEPNTYRYNYHYDTTAYPFSMGRESNLGEQKAFANVFPVSNDDDQVLEAVSIATATADANIIIEVYTKDSKMNNPTDGTKRITQSVYKQTAGIFTIELDDRIELPKGTYFSIIVRAYSDSDEVFEMYVDRTASMNDNEIVFVNEATLGQSFHSAYDSTNNTYGSWTDFNTNLLQEHPYSEGKTAGNNWRIKALTNLANEPVEHIIDKNWFSSTGAGINGTAVTKITVQIGGDIDSYDAVWDIDGEGLKGYRVNNTEIIIYAPKNDTIATGEDASYLFSSSTSNTFDKATGLYGLKNIDTSRATTMERMFYNFGNGYYNACVIEDLETLDVSNVKNMTWMFAYANRIVDGTLDLSKWNTSNLEIIDTTFRFHSGTVKHINLKGWNTSKLTKMKAAFQDCYSVETIDLSTFDTSKVEDFSSCFTSCGNLTTIYASENFIVKDSAKNTTGMMFYGCEKLVGGNGTVWNSEHTNSDYAKIDKPGQVGYFTELIDPDTEWTVEFVTNNGVTDAPSISDIKVKHGNTVTKPVDPTLTGYIFGGWYKEEGTTNAWDFTNDTVTNNTTLYAKWTAITYTISYNANGGQVSPASITKTYGTSVELANPTKTGYTFNGWYSNSTLTTAYDGTTDLATEQGKAVYIYAKWTAITYTINYNTNGGQVSPTSVTKTYGTNVTLANPTKTGYTFGGWYTDNNTFNTSYNGTTDLSSTQGATVDIYAKWNENNYTITLNRNSGEYVNGYTAPTSRKYTESKTLPTSANITRTGYTFGGWYENSSFSGSQVTTIPANTASNKTYYLKWTENNYTITLNTNGGAYKSGYEAPTSRKYSQSATLPTSTNITKTGYTFGGWYTNSSLTGTAVTTVAANTAEDKQFWAKWTAIQYTIKYNANGGTVSPTSVTKTYGTNVTLATPTKTGYTFNGWYSNDTLTAAYNGTTDLATTQGASVNIYAKWTGVTYTITHNLNGVSATAPANITKTYGTNVTLSNPTNIPSGYEFLGWYEDNTFKTQYTGNKDLSSTQGVTITIYAKWKRAIVFDANGHGTAPASKEITSATQITLPNITATGYVFGGWYDGANTDVSNKVGNAGQNINVSEPKTFYAKWTPITYTINYNTNGGTVAEASITKTYDTNATLANPTKTGYTFSGWFSDSTLKTVYNGTTDLSTTQGATVTIYAKWTAVTYTINYNAIGGTISPESVTKTYNTNIKLSQPTSAPSGYTFDGWFSDSSLTTAYMGTTDLANTQNANVTIYARWKENEYSITLNTNGGTYVSGYTATTKRKYTQSATLPTSDQVTKKGHTFDGWYENNSFNGSPVTSVAKNTAANKTYYAKWIANVYNITYNLSGNTGSGYISGKQENGYTVTDTYTFGTVKTLPTNVVADIATMSFAGWYENANLTGSKITSIAKDVEGDKIYYAKYEKKVDTYTIVFKPGTGGTGTMANQIVPAGKKTKLNYCTFTRKNYYMAYWTDQNGNIISDGAEIVATKNLTLTANWVKSGGGGGGTVSQNQQQNNVNNNNSNKDISTNTVSVNVSEANWVKDQTTGKWKLNLSNTNNQAQNASNGFVQITSVVNGVISVDTYCFNQAGEMVVGWVQTADKGWRYMDSNADRLGIQVNNSWKKVDGKFYYFDANGKLMTNALTPSNVYVDSNGEMVDPTGYYTTQFSLMEATGLKIG